MLFLRLTFDEASQTAVPQEAKPIEAKPLVINEPPPAANAAGKSAKAPSAGIAAPINRSGHLYEEPSVKGNATQFNGNSGFDQVAGGSHTYTKPVADGTGKQYNGNTSIEFHKGK